MSLTRMLVLSAILLLAGCGPSPEEFAQECQRVAGIEVQNHALWRDYLRERKQKLAQSKVTVNGVEIDPTDLQPIVYTENFQSTNDWVRAGRPPTPSGKAYKNDIYVVRKDSGQTVAVFKNLNVSVPSFETTLGWTCTDNYPHLYTGARQHKGGIASMSR